MTGVVELVGVGLAAPGVLDTIGRGGELLYDKIATFRKIDKTMSDFRELALDLKEGTLFFALQTLKSSSRDRTIPSKIKEQLDRVLGNVQRALASAEHGIDHVKEHTFLGRLQYTVWRGQGSKRQLDGLFKELETSGSRLKDLCFQLHQFEVARPSNLLTSDVFKLLHESPDDRAGAFLPDSDILVAHGNYVDNQHGRLDGDFVLEEKSRENDVRFLSATLCGRNDVGGVLPVRGYRQPPYNDMNGGSVFQLVFNLPGGTDRESLAHRMLTNPEPSMRRRIRICVDITQALSKIHASQLVHKSLHTRSVLMLKEASKPEAQTSIYLQDWSYVRELCGATTQRGENDWPKRIYQHPARQGRYADEAYEQKHDIYSLGVCMLEVFLWQPFVVTSVQVTGETLSVCDVFQRHGLALADANRVLPEYYRGNSEKLTCRPWSTKAIWLEIATTELGDAGLTELIIKCLEGEYQNTQEVVDALQGLETTR